QQHHRTTTNTTVAAAAATVIVITNCCPATSPPKHLHCRRIPHPTNTNAAVSITTATTSPLPSTTTPPLLPRQPSRQWQQPSPQQQQRWCLLGVVGSKEGGSVTVHAARGVGFATVRVLVLLVSSHGGCLFRVVSSRNGMFV
nr:hypothetical protein [Tanacetum cinerariifolium]